MFKPIAIPICLYGETWTAEENETADRALADDLARSGKWHQRITGYSPTTGHAEPGWAVEMNLPEACELGLRYLQDAIYYVSGDELFRSALNLESRHLWAVFVNESRINPHFPAL